MGELQRGRNPGESAGQLPPRGEKAEAGLVGIRQILPGVHHKMRRSAECLSDIYLNRGPVEGGGDGMSWGNRVGQDMRYVEDR